MEKMEKKTAPGRWMVLWIVATLLFGYGCVQNTPEENASYIEVKSDGSIRIFLAENTFRDEPQIHPQSVITSLLFRRTGNDSIHFYESDCLSAGMDFDSCLDGKILTHTGLAEAIGFSNEPGFYGKETGEDGFFYSPELIADYPENDGEDYYCSSFPTNPVTTDANPNYQCVLLGFAKCSDGLPRYSCGINPHPVSYLDVSSPIIFSLYAADTRGEPRKFRYSYIPFDRSSVSFSEGDVVYLYLLVHYHGVNASENPFFRFKADSSVFSKNPDIVSPRIEIRIPEEHTGTQTYLIPDFSLWRKWENKI